MKIQRYAIKLDKLAEEQLKIADVNKGGKVNSKDALTILRFTLGFKDKGTVFID